MTTTDTLPGRTRLAGAVSPSVRETVTSWVIVISGVTIPILGLAAGVALAWWYGWFGAVDLALFLGL